MADPISLRPPLGLPRGSVRALLTLLIVAVVMVQLVHDQPVGLLWTETLMIALAHYFTSRRLLDLTPEALSRLEAEGLLPRESSPLYLPKHSIRILLFSAFLGLALYLYLTEKPFTLQALTLLGVFASYVLGLMLRAIRSWWTGGRQTPGIRLWEDIKAGIVLVALGVTATIHLLGYPDLLPKELESVALGLVLFYFGSR